MSISTVERVTLDSPAQFAASLPALVGFEPHESLVCTYLKDRSVVLTMRTDLPESWNGMADYVLNAGRRADATEVVIAVCTDAAGAGQALQGDVRSLCGDLDGAGLSVRDVLLTSCGRYWSFLCESPECCPPEGNVIPEETWLVAARVGSGALSPAASREEVLARYAPNPEQAPPAELLAAADTSGGSANPRERAERAWDAVQALALMRTSADVLPITNHLRSVVISSFDDVRARDYVLGWIANGDLEADPLVEALVGTALCAPEDRRARVAGAAAAALAAFGDSSLPAQCLADLAGDDSLAGLVRTALSAAVPPSEMRAILRESFTVTVDRLCLNDTGPKDALH